MTAPETILKRVTILIAQVLGVDADVVTPNASLFDDLGADSTDLLDVALRLERAFRLQGSLRELLLDSTYPAETGRDRHGRATTEDVAIQRVRMLLNVVSDPEPGRRPHSLTDWFTVDLIARYVERKVENRRNPTE